MEVLKQTTFKALPIGRDYFELEGYQWMKTGERSISWPYSGGPYWQDDDTTVWTLPDQPAVETIRALVDMMPRRLSGRGIIYRVRRLLRAVPLERLERRRLLRAAVLAMELCRLLTKSKRPRRSPAGRLRFTGQAALKR